jgi:hypothetical protein
MNYQMHFDPYLIKHLKQRDDVLLQEAEALRQGNRVRKNRKPRGSSRLAALIKGGRLRVGGVRLAH